MVYTDIAVLGSLLSSNGDQGPISLVGLSDSIWWGIAGLFHYCLVRVDI